MPTTVLGDVRLVGAGHEPVDLVIEAGRIAAVALAGNGFGERVDLAGRYVLSGLWDHHVHLNQYALARDRIDLSRVESAAEAARVVQQYVAERRPSAGIRIAGFGFRDGLWPDTPDKALLDAVAPGLPIALASGDLHSVWLNSAGLMLVGAAGHPSGLLREDAVPPVLETFQTMPANELDALVLAAAKEQLASRGVVGIVDLEAQRNPQVWARRSRMAASPLPLRVEGGVYAGDLDWAIGEGLRSGDQLTGDGLVRMGPLKVLTDGSLNTRTAYCDDPYPGLTGPESHGLLVVPQAELVRLMAEAHAHGIVPAIHAIGDHANGLALDAFAAVGCGGRIEHAQLVRDEDFERFAALGVEASVQPFHAVDDRDVADVHWAGRTSRAFAYADLWRAGARLRLGSDAPVAPPDPWLTLQAAVLRTVDERQPWHAEQRLPVQVALDASTADGATPRVGRPADLVVVERDPLTTPPDQLGAMPVYATMVAGHWTWLR